MGDTVTVSGETYKVVGLLAYVNYSTLHEKTTDLMFDALKFDVAMVTQDGFDRLHKSIHYTYAWKYETEPADEAGEKTRSDNFMRALLTQVVVADNELEDYTPKYGNPAINFATDDMGSDKAMGGVLLDILVVIIAFIFAVTISNTIAKESSAIGTLRASGYTKGELVRHYLSMPVIVTLLAAIVGNILGYTVFKNIVVSMYYNSYSLPTYYTIWNPDAFFKTTVVPVILMLVVNLIVIVRMMQHTPLQFLRHDLKKAKNKKAMRLPRWSFLSRFRLRIMFQNVANYLILFVGIFFIMIMLAMAVGMPDTLDYYIHFFKAARFLVKGLHFLGAVRGDDADKALPQPVPCLPPDSQQPCCTAMPGGAAPRLQRGNATAWGSRPFSNFAEASVRMPRARAALRMAVPLKLADSNTTSTVSDTISLFSPPMMPARPTARCSSAITSMVGSSFRIPPSSVVSSSPSWARRHDNFSAPYIPIVKGVHGLTVLQHHIVGDIHDVVDGPNPHSAQAFPHPFGRRGNFDVSDHPGGVPGAQLRIRRLHIQKFRQAAAAAA